MDSFSSYVVGTKERKNDNGEIKKPSWKRAIKPVLFCMTLSGCYDFSDINSNDKVGSKQITLSRVLSLVYRIFVLSVTLLVFARFVSVFYFLLDFKIWATNVLMWKLYLVTCWFVCLNKPAGMVTINRSYGGGMMLLFLKVRRLALFHKV